MKPLDALLEGDLHHNGAPVPASLQMLEPLPRPETIGFRDLTDREIFSINAGKSLNPLALFHLDTSTIESDRIAQNRWLPYMKNLW